MGNQDGKMLYTLIVRSLRKGREQGRVRGNGRR